MRDQLRLGLWINDIDAPLKRAISHAAALGFGGIELSLDHPEIQPDTFSESGRRHLARLVRTAGLTLVSIAGSPGPSQANGANQPSDTDQMVVRASAALQMARDMDVRLATLHADFFGFGIESDAGKSGTPDLASPDSVTPVSGARASGARASGMGDSQPDLSSMLGALADVSDRFGVTLAVRGGWVDVALFSDLVRRVGCPTLRIAFDPIDVLLAGGDPVASLEYASDLLEIAYIRDASPRHGDRGGYACDIGGGGLELDRYLADVSQCVRFERMILRGPRAGRRMGDIERDISRLTRAELFRGRE